MRQFMQNDQCERGAHTRNQVMVPMGALGPMRRACYRAFKRRAHIRERVICNVSHSLSVESGGAGWCTISV